MASQLKRSKTLARMEMDRISNVPGNVMDQILSYLPIKDAVKTSVLSTKWRNRWATIPSLVFDDMSFPLPLDSKGHVSVKKLVMAIDRILLLHAGPIDKFKLCYKRKIHSVDTDTSDGDFDILNSDIYIPDYDIGIPDDDINKWILYLSRHTVKELVCILGMPSYQMPSYLFSYRNLTRLELRGCALRPPSSFKGFKELKSLDLHDVKLSQFALEYMISSSPLLERLTLHGVFGTVNIDAPNLLYVKLKGVFRDVNLKSTSRVVDFVVDLGPICLDGSLIKLLDNMPRVRRLAVEGLCIENLTKGLMPQELLVPCVYLENLTIQLNLSNSEDTSTLLFLLRNAPNLRQLDIRSYWISGTSSVMWEADKLDIPFTCLQDVKIVFRGKEAEMRFISFMLLTSPALQRMTVMLHQVGDDAECDRSKWEVAKQLLCFRRASAQAMIVFLGY